MSRMIAVVRAACAGATGAAGALTDVSLRGSGGALVMVTGRTARQITLLRYLGDRHPRGPGNGAHPRHHVRRAGTA